MSQISDQFLYKPEQHRWWVNINLLRASDSLIHPTMTECLWQDKNINLSGGSLRKVLKQNGRNNEVLQLTGMNINSYVQREKGALIVSLIRKGNYRASKRHALAKKPAVTAFLTACTRLKTIEH